MQIVIKYTAHSMFLLSMLFAIITFFFSGTSELMASAISMIAFYYIHERETANE